MKFHVQVQVECVRGHTEVCDVTGRDVVRQSLTAGALEIDLGDVRCPDCGAEPVEGGIVLVGEEIF